jgi:hypothetical protein
MYIKTKTHRNQNNYNLDNKMQVNINGDEGDQR